MPSDDHPSQDSRDPANRPKRRRRRFGPGPVRLLVAVGDRPARWYRSPAEAAADARTLLDDVAQGEVIARAWTAAPAAGPPAWELCRGPRRSIAWTQPSDG
jgi:hypothetical protein